MTEETPHIRRYAPEDHESVLKLHEAGLREVGAFIEDPEIYRDLLDIEASYCDGGEFLVGVCRGQVVAMGALRRTSPGRAEIKRMRVEPDHQERGFGHTILSALEKRAAELGYTELHLDTAVHLQPARRLYEKNDYREARRGRIGPFECVFYEKNLV